EGGGGPLLDLARKLRGDAEAATTGPPLPGGGQCSDGQGARGGQALLRQSALRPVGRKVRGDDLGEAARAVEVDGARNGRAASGRGRGGQRRPRRGELGPVVDLGPQRRRGDAGDSAV